MGSTLFAFLGGMYYWWPKFFGKMYHENWGRLAFLVILVGFNLTFFPQFIAGTLGHAAAVRHLSAAVHRLQPHGYCGAYIMAIGLILAGTQPASRVCFVERKLR